MNLKTAPHQKRKNSMSLDQKFNLSDVKDIRKEQFHALFNIAKLLNNTEFSESLIEESLDWVVHIIKAERAVFAQYNTGSSSFEIISARNIDKKTISDLSQFSSGVLSRVVEKKEPVIYHDVQSDPDISQFESIKIHHIKSVIGVPILYQNKIWGVILADSLKSRQKFNQATLEFMQFFSSLLSLALDRIKRLESLEKRNAILQNELEQFKHIPKMIGESQAIKQLSVMIRKVAQTNATVLITGESGTGKDLAAHAIHTLSARKDNPYLALFCGSIPDTLLESELFGFKKGAFSGAVTDKKGLFEVADKGTFFLDEIADISTALQAKLLRVIQNQEIIRLGDTAVKKVDTRIITATNKNLGKLVKEGLFREDLFYRLNVFPIHIPPLRERLEDLLPLAEYFMKKYATHPVSLSTEVITKLKSFSWPGNVRQLENTIQRALILCEGNKILPGHIVLETEPEGLNVNSNTLKEIENSVLLQRLKIFNENRTQTAQSLGVSVRWIQLRLKELGIQ